MLDADESLTEPRLARDLVGALPGGALLWIASSQPVRDIDGAPPPRADLHVLASRGASGIDGTTSSAIGAALAHGGPAFALIGDLALVHDAAGLALGPDEPRPDLCLVVVNNDGGGIFSALEPAAFPGSFERLFGTPHGTGLDHLAAAFGLPYQRLERPGDLPKALQGSGLRIVEAQTNRAGPPSCGPGCAPRPPRPSAGCSPPGRAMFSRPFPALRDCLCRFAGYVRDDDGIGSGTDRATQRAS